jgi:gas vesicle protein
MSDELFDDTRVQVGDMEVAINPDDSDDSAQLDDGAVLWGAIVGFVVGAVVWFFNTPRRGLITRQALRGAGDNLRERLEASDPVTDSIEEGKALAKQRQQTTRSRTRNSSSAG